MMKILVGSTLGSMMSAVLLAGAAHGQALPPRGEVATVVRVSDVGEPYAAPGYGEPRVYVAPRVYDEAPPRVYDAPRYGYAPDMLAPREVYGIVRQAGFSPLGMLQQRGPVYTVAAVDPNGEDGRLVIDARSGRIVRFMPAYGLRDREPDDVYVREEPAGAPPVLPQYRRAPYSAAPAVAGPRVASRTPAVSQPKRAPVHAVAAPAKPVAANVARPAAVAPPAPQPAAAPVQQSAVTTPAAPAPEVKAAETTGIAPAAPTPASPTPASPKTEAAPPTVPAPPVEAKPADKTPDAPAAQ